MASTPVPAQSAEPASAIIVAVPSDPASAAAFAAANLFAFFCTPTGQKIVGDAEAVGKAVSDAVKTLAQDVVNIFRGIHL